MLASLTSSNLYTSAEITGTSWIQVQSFSNVAGFSWIVNTTMYSHITEDTQGNMIWRTNISSNTQLPCKLSYLGYVDCSNRNAINNKMLVFSENGTADTVLNATSFSGFGINTSTMRYQVPNS